MTISIKQWQGPFLANQEIKLIDLLPLDINIETTLFKIGIFSQRNHKILISQKNMEDKQIEIGVTGMLEVRDVNITSFTFLQDEPETTTIECMIENDEI